MSTVLKLSGSLPLILTATHLSGVDFYQTAFLLQIKRKLLLLDLNGGVKRVTSVPEAGAPRNPALEDGC